MRIAGSFHSRETLVLTLTIACLLQGVSTAFAVVPAALLLIGGITGLGRIWLLRPVFLLCAYLVYLLINLVVTGSLGDLASVEFWRYDGKQVYTLSIFLLGTAFFVARPRLSLDDFNGAVLTSALLLLPFVLIFGEWKFGILNGFYNSHNALAGMVGAMFIVFVHMILASKTPRRHTAWKIWSAIILTSCLFVLAQSRAFLFGMALSMTYVFLTNARGLMGRKYLIAGTGLLLMVAVASSPFSDRLSVNYLRDDTNLEKRFEYWLEAADFIQRSPILGVGLGTINDDHMTTREYAPFLELRTRSSTFHGENHAHNVVLQIWAELGLIALILYSYFWAAIFRRQPRSADHRASEYERTRAVLTAMFIYVAGASVFGNNLLTPASAALLYLLAAFFVARTSSVSGAAALRRPIGISGVGIGDACGERT